MKIKEKVSPWKRAQHAARSGLKVTLRIIVMIASILLIIAFLRWGGIKGISSFVLGMSLMAYLLLSKNMMFQGIISMFGADEYLNDVGGRNNNKASHIVNEIGKKK